MGKIKFEPPKTIIKDDKTYKYIETKTINKKGEVLSEPCYWYEVLSKLEPLTKGNIEYILSNN